MRSNSVLAILCLAASAVAMAEEPAESMFLLSGFGTLGVVHSSEDQADFGASVFAANGAGHTRSWSPEVDSRLGAQLTARFTPKLTATLQLVAEQGHDGDYTPHVEWANIKYELTPQFSMRVGRTALASFLVSDFRKVSYVNPWVRPPVSVYGLIPVYSSDGVDASYRFETGSATHTLMAGFGRTSTKVKGGDTYKSRNHWILSDTIEAGDATLRAAWLTGRVKVPTLDSMMAGFRQFGPQGIALADRYDPNGRVTFLALGGTYDPGPWFVMAEWGLANLRSAFGKRSSWYSTAGYRIRTVTPYLTYARTDPHSNRSDPGLSLTGLPSDAAAAATMLNAGLNAALGAMPVQQTTSGGIRWDWRKNLAMSAQYDHLDLAPGSAGVLGNLQPGFVPGGKVNLISLSVDFVW